MTQVMNIWTEVHSEIYSFDWSTHPKLPSMVRLLFFDDVVRLTFCNLILTWSPNLLNCLSNCLINSKSSAGSALNVSSTFFGPFVGLRCVVAFFSDWFDRDDLQSTRFVHVNTMTIICTMERKCLRTLFHRLWKFKTKNYKTQEASGKKHTINK